MSLIAKVKMNVDGVSTVNTFTNIERINLDDDKYVIIEATDGISNIIIPIRYIVLIHTTVAPEEVEEDNENNA